MGVKTDMRFHNPIKLRWEEALYQHYMEVVLSISKQRNINKGM